LDELARAIATGGTFGLILALLVAVWAFATGRVRVGSVVDADRKAEAERHAIEVTGLRTERNEALSLVKVAQDNFATALDIIEGRTPK
jgi:hypothetical protein